jgi:hypothetical protein
MSLNDKNNTENKHNKNNLKYFTPLVFIYRLRSRIIIINIIISCATETRSTDQMQIR